MLCKCGTFIVTIDEHLFRYNVTNPVPFKSEMPFLYNRYNVLPASEGRIRVDGM